MAFIGNNPKANTYTFTPQSADPTNPTEGMVFRSDGTSRSKGLWEYKDSAWVQGGSGAGDADTIHLIEAEVLAAISEVDLTGNNASFDGGGTITASSLTLSTTAADLIKSATKVISYDPNADGSNDYFGFTKAIPKGLRGRDLGFSFEYKNDSTTVNDDFRFCVKQKDGTLINQIDYFNMEAYNTTDGNSKKFATGDFIAGDCTEVEFGWQNTSTTTTVELHVDNILVTSDPYETLNLSNDTEWTSYTPTYLGFGTVSNDQVFYRRVGDTLFLRGKFTSGTSTAVKAEISLPTGLTLDTGKFDNDVSILGTFIRNVTGGNANTGGFVLGQPGDTSNIAFSAGSVFNSTSMEPLTSVNGSSFVNTGEVVAFLCEIPITGWTATSEHVVTPATSANVSSAHCTTTTNIGNSTTTFLDFETINKDIDGRFKGEGSGFVTTTKTGFYWESDRTGEVRLNASTAFLNSAVWVAGEWARLSLYKNGTLYRHLDYFEMAGSPGSAFVMRLTGGTMVDVVSGDYLEVAMTQASGGSLALSGNAEDNFVDVNFTGSANFLAALPLDYTQTKILSSDFTTDASNITDLTFSNLEIGKYYEYKLKALISTVSTDAITSILVRHDSATIDTVQNSNRDAGATHDPSKFISGGFVATATTLTFQTSSLGAGSSILGNGTKTETWAQITEKNMTKETTRFT